MGGSARGWRWIALGLGAWLACAVGATARAAELVTDGGFDDPTLAEWNLQIFDTSTIGVDADATGDAGSWSLLLRKKLGENPNSLRVTQCIETVPGTQLDLSARLRIPTQSAAGAAFLSFQWWEEPGCGGSILGNYDAPVFTPPPDTWTSLGPFSPEVPAGADSVLLYVGVVVTVDPGSPEVFEASWDDVSVVPEPGGAGAAAALGALAHLLRRRRPRPARG